MLTSLELCARIAKGNEKVFGGIQVILFGDFCQLPPVVRNAVDITYAFESRTWANMKLKVCTLSESFRQKTDLTFYKLLNR